MLIKEACFTVFDVETTGLHPYSGDRICEIGAIKLMPDGKKPRFHSMVNPGREISQGAFAVNGITPEMLDGQPPIEEVLPGFMEFIKGSVLVAYNAGFDLGFIECALGHDKGRLSEYRIIDALKLARRFFPGIGRYNLQSVSRALNIRSSGAHRAMSDAQMTVKVFLKVLDAITASGAEAVDDIVQAQERRVEPLKVVSDYRMSMIESAIMEQKKINITYLSDWNNKTTKRTITPKGIQKGYGKPYVTAYCHLRDEERTFKFGGILDVEPHDGKDGKEEN
jgi:DNA polymerase III epsilon subunit